jgi:hypothetical protein
MANKFQSAMPGALLGTDHIIGLQLLSRLRRYGLPWRTGESGQAPSGVGRRSRAAGRKRTVSRLPGRRGAEPPSPCPVRQQLGPTCPEKPRRFDCAPSMAIASSCW